MLFSTFVGVFAGVIDKAGLLEKAVGDHLLLDEINSQPVSRQASPPSW